jgi:hypothetical protein
VLLAQNASCCRYACIRVRWHARMRVVTATHIRQQAACADNTLRSPQHFEGGILS